MSLPPIDRHSLDCLDAETPLPAMSPRQKAWQDLIEIAPDLKALKAPQFPTALPPSRLSDGVFLALCACFIDPRTRTILRAVLLDLIDDDLRKLVLSFLVEDRP